ncbi:MAG: hypothetical protein K8T26_11925 [Lentisphaerae bacterium]|nr:hypothetical protein [Lentisphaerota bacterium]
MFHKTDDVTIDEAPAHPPAKSRAGVGLIEVVIALFIFAGSVAGMCALVLMVREASDRARDHYVAVNLAKNRLERAKSFGFSQLSLFAENQVPMNSQGAPNAKGDFRRTTVVSNIAANLTEVRVTVEIRNRDTWEFVPGEEDIRSYVADITEHP